MSSSVAQRKKQELDELLDNFGKGLVEIQELFSMLKEILEGYNPNEFMSQFTVVYAVQSLTVVFNDGRVVRISWTSKLEELSPTNQ